MRIISGIWKGQPINSPSVGTRPSTDRTRQALFNILQHVVKDAHVLDLFAGSGGLSLECLSRGASSATAVELDKASCQVIEKNARSLKAKNYTVLQRDVLSFLQQPSTQKFNLVFADPPYENDFSSSLLLEVLSHEALLQRLAPESYFIAESPQNLVKTGLIPPHWEVITKRKYGKCHITILQLKASA